MSEWQKIETQPFDGKLILFHSRNGGIYIAPSIKNEELQTSFVRKQMAKLVSETGTWPNAGYIPTHWMPLPEPPTE